jgi:hypothetical protein
MRAIIAMAMLLTVSAANPQEDGSAGAGTSSCTQFAEDYRQDPQTWELVYFSWAQGAMSGLNAGHRGRHLLARSTYDQEAFIRSYCNSHPLNNYSDAVTELYNTLPF